MMQLLFAPGMIALMITFIACQIASHHAYLIKYFDTWTVADLLPSLHSSS